MARTARFGALVAGVAALVVVASACGSSGSSNASPPKSSGSATSTTAPQIIVEPSGVRIVKGSANGSSPCEKAAPTPSSPGELGGGTGSNSDVTDAAGVAAEEHGARGQVVPNPLTSSQQATLNQQLAAAATVAKKYATVKDAVAAGYMESTPYVPCIGAHYTNFGLAIAGSIRRSPPSCSTTAPRPTSKIVGLSYLVFHHLQPAAGFRGPERLAGTSTTPTADCASRVGS